MPPISSVASPATRVASSGSVASPGTAKPDPISVTSSSKRSSRLADTVTRAPCETAALANAAPKPEEAPTTRIFFLSNKPSVGIGMSLPSTFATPA